ncbi:MAG: hypothetical protein WBV81_00195 [Ignavibacteriaceae bacterium]
MRAFLIIHKQKLIFIPFAVIYLVINIDSYPRDKSISNNHKINDSTLMQRQHMIHSESHMVMPFDMNKVTHYFIKNDSGGILMIKTKNKKDTAQAALVQMHLKKEFKLFSDADFRDPKTLHGMNMPGLKVLSGSKGKYNVEFKELPDGAQLTFISKDSAVIDAIYVWFDAQLKDHGRDAKNRLD